MEGLQPRAACLRKHVAEKSGINGTLVRDRGSPQTLYQMTIMKESHPGVWRGIRERLRLKATTQEQDLHIGAISPHVDERGAGGIHG
jgi:hypothetical protein